LKGKNISDNDHFAFLLIPYFAKQREHMDSVIVLNPSRDMNLIVRSMLEGASQLYWIAKKEDPKQIQDAALLFRQFGIIHDWRLMRRLEKQGKAIDPEQKSYVLGAIKERDPSFSKKAPAGNPKTPTGKTGTVKALQVLWSYLLKAIPQQRCILNPS
jgi:Family of unknown function (DUF5677)